VFVKKMYDLELILAGVVVAEIYLIIHFDLTS